MNWLSKIFSSGSSELIDSIGTAIDRITTSDEERQTIKALVAKQIQLYNLEIAKEAIKYEQEITKGWTSDNEHIITRMVRPLSYVFVLTLFGGIVLFDGDIGKFAIQEAYVPVIQTLLITMTVSYFGSRGYEKIVKLRGK